MSPKRSRWARWGSIVLIAIGVIILLPPIIVSISPDPPVTAAVANVPPGTYHVYVADWGYHTSIIFQQPTTWQLGSLGAETAPFVEFAWGDRRFYIESIRLPCRQRLRWTVLSRARPLSLVHRLQPLDSGTSRLRGPGARWARSDLLWPGRRPSHRLSSCAWPVIVLISAEMNCHSN